jgi:tetratricopeptide (TPR) repeat protein
MLANTYIQESQLAKAEVLLESLVMMEPASYEDALLVEKATGELAQIYFKQGRSIEEQQRLCRETSRMGCFGPPPSALAQICIQTGDYSKAESILNAHITSPVEITKSYKADYCDLYALLLKKTGRTQESAAWEKHGNALHQQNKHRSLAELYWDCAQDHARDHNLRHAMLFFALCAEQTRLADPHDDNRALEELSKYYSVAGDYGNLKQALFERLSIAEFQKNKASMVQIWCEIGQSLLAQNQLTAAESAVQKGVEILDELIAGKEPGVTMQYAEKLQSLVHDLRSRGNTRAVANLQRRIDRLSRTIGT